MTPTSWPSVSVIIVHRGPTALLRRCLKTLRALDYPADRIEVILAEERRTGAADLLKAFPRSRHIAVGENNYCRANNLAVRAARSPFVALLNNDCLVDRSWLARLAATMDLDPRLAGCMGKLRFPSGKIHSAGHEDVGHGHVRDLGFGEPDGVRFDLPGPRSSITHAACLYRRDAYLAAGGMDERFVMYYDDVDLGHRLTRAGWRFFYVPAAGAVHARAPEGTRLWTEFFCHRNRLLFAAREHPRDLAAWLFHSRLTVDPDWHPVLYHVIPELFERLPAPGRALPSVSRVLARRGVPAAFRERILGRARVAAGLKKPALLIYDHALHFVGGGQRFAVRIAEELSDRLRPTFLAHFRPPGGLRALQGGRRTFPVRVLPAPRHLGAAQVDPGMARDTASNPFEAVSRASGEAPFFLNANMVVAVKPLSDQAVFLCHFPDQPPAPPFHVPDYDLLLCNSRYTRGWIRRRWHLDPHHLVYPPIDMAAPARPKERLILSVARFESSGSKLQHEMILAFAALRRRAPPGWRLVLAGGSVAGNRLPTGLRAELLRRPGLPVEILENPPAAAIRGLYARASIFWHLCGLGATDPVRREHFGMSVVEAMQNGCVPVVFDGGGLRESVRDGIDGFRARDLRAFKARTLDLMKNAALRHRLSRAAAGRAALFGPARFRAEIRRVLLPLVNRYARPAPPSVDEVRSGRFMEDCRRVWERASASSR